MKSRFQSSRSIKLLYCLLVSGGVLCLVCVCLYVIFKKTEHYSDSDSDSNSNQIPKIIWTFWDSDTLPPIIEACIASWKRFNPDYEIRVLNKTNLPEYISNGASLPDLPRSKDFIARLADFVRIHALAEHGGVWMDASIICTESLKTIIPDTNPGQPADYIGFYLPGFTTRKEWPVIENWFMAAPKNSPFIIQWRDEFMKSNNYPTVDEYLADVKRRNVDIQKIDPPDYLAMHVAAQAVLQQKDNNNTNNNNTPMKFRMQLHDATSDTGPYRYLVKNDWNSKASVSSICRGQNITPLIKLRGLERKAAASMGEDMVACIKRITEGQKANHT